MTTDGLPILTHDVVLGAVIGVHQRRNEMVSRGMKYPLNSNVDDEVKSTGERYIDDRERRYIAAWVRRNL